MRGSVISQEESSKSMLGYCTLGEWTALMQEQQFNSQKIS